MLSYKCLSLLHLLMCLQCTPVSNESPVSTFETGSRISVFQSRVRDGIENFFLPVSCLETRSRFSFFQSHASRRAREFFHLISGFETRARNSVISSQFSRRERDFFWLFPSLNMFSLMIHWFEPSQ